MANAQVHVDFLENGRGGYYLLHAGYKFSIKTRRHERCYWRCVDRQCPATIITLDNIPVANGHPQHNHPANQFGLATDAFIVSVKKRCREEVNPVPAIYDEMLGQLRNRECYKDVVDMIRQVPMLYSCRSSLYRNRAKQLPKLPVTQNDINLDGPWNESSAVDRSLLCDDTDDLGAKLLVFATDDNLQKLSSAPVLYGDGTLYACTGLFYQLYTIHAVVGGQLFPLVFALLPNKTQRTYTIFFTLLKDTIAERDFVLNPETVMLDFEVAARNAVTEVFPMSTLLGCFFHFTQCIWKKAQSCGLAVQYRQDPQTQKLVRRAAVLPLVPAQQVDNVWLNALADNDDNSIQTTKFKDYVTEIWVEGNIQGWNQFDNDGARTTNHIEGWHSKVNKACQRSHPNIFVMVKLLQKEQAVNEAKIIQLQAGDKQCPRRKKYRKLDSRLQALKN